MAIITTPSATRPVNPCHEVSLNLKMLIGSVFLPRFRKPGRALRPILSVFSRLGKLDLKPSTSSTTFLAVGYRLILLSHRNFQYTVPPPEAIVLVSGRIRRGYPLPVHHKGVSPDPSR
jgi:hypothetical protein